MYIDKIIKKETITLLISVGLLLIIFIGVSFASFFKIDEGKDNVVETGDLNISFCNDSTCDTTYENIGQVIGTTKQDGTSVPASIYPYPNDGTYSNATPYIFKVTNTGTMDAIITIKLKEDEDFLPTGDYSEYQRLTSLYSEHLKVAVRKKVLASGSEHQLGDVDLNGIVNYDDATLLVDIATKNITPTDEQKKVGDIDGDGEIDANDVDYLNEAINGQNDHMMRMTHINSFSTLSNNIIYSGDKIAPGESETYFLWLYMDETTPNQAQKTYFVGNLNIEGEFVPDNIPFSEASWSNIASNIRSGNTGAYKVGDTKEVDLGTLGKHNVRIANISTPSECSNSSFSQTACGFVLEFEDIITKYAMYSQNATEAGWPSSQARTFLNENIYNLLPSDLRSVIIDTKVISGNGDKTSTTTDKIYLLTPQEIYSNFKSDLAGNLSRQLDYYSLKGVTTTNTTSAIKSYMGTVTYYWLRSIYQGFSDCFYYITSDGKDYGGDIIPGVQSLGISPVFRIG